MALELFLHTTYGTVDLRPEDVERIRCHVFIMQLKDRGLAEAVESLRDMVGFYSEEPAPALSPPVHSVQGKIGRSYTSTVPPISEEL